MSILAEKVWVRNLAKIKGRLSSAAMTVLPAPIQQRRLQQQQITGLSILHKRIIQRHKCVTQRGKNGSGLVGAESASEQRTVHIAHYPIDSNPIWCFQDRLGSSVLRGISQRPWITKGKKEAYQPHWIKSSSYGCNDFRIETKPKVSPLTDGQSGSISIHEKNGE